MKPLPAVSPMENLRICSKSSIHAVYFRFSLTTYHCYRPSQSSCETMPPRRVIGTYSKISEWAAVQCPVYSVCYILSIFLRLMWGISQVKLPPSVFMPHPTVPASTVSRSCYRGRRAAIECSPSSLFYNIAIEYIIIINICSGAKYNCFLLSFVLLPKLVLLVLPMVLLMLLLLFCSFTPTLFQYLLPFHFHDQCSKYNISTYCWHL